MPSPRPHTSLALLALLALGACSQRRSTPRATGSATPTSPTTTPAPPPVPPGRGARVVVNVSESNRGFTSATSVAIESLHRVIDASLSATQLNNPYQRCLLDESLRCESPGPTPRLLGTPATYHGRYSALHLALRRPPQAPRPDLQQPDPLDPYAVTLLVTDGFQSSSSAFQPDAGEDVACTAGADPSCMAALLRRRVDEGYGVWVLRLVMPFNGRYFAERRLDAQKWAQVQAHVEALNRDPAWNGVHFTVGSPNLTGDSGPFQFTGARPLLVFLLSRDHATARRLVAELVRQLGVERITQRQSAGDLAASEWAPFEGLLASVQGAARAEAGGAADELRVERAVRSPAGLTVPVRCSIQGKARIALQGGVSGGAIPPPRFARVDLGWRFLSRPAPEVLLPRERIAAQPGAFTVHTGVDCTVLQAGEYAHVLALWGSWSVDEGALADEWFVRESATTSYEMPERVYGLAELARTVVTAGVARAGALDRVTLQVRRE